MIPQLCKLFHSLLFLLGQFVHECFALAFLRFRLDQTVLSKGSQDLLHVALALDSFRLSLGPALVGRQRSFPLQEIAQDRDHTFRFRSCCSSSATVSSSHARDGQANSRTLDPIAFPGILFSPSFAVCDATRPSSVLASGDAIVAGWTKSTSWNEPDQIGSQEVSTLPWMPESSNNPSILEAQMPHHQPNGTTQDVNGATSWWGASWIWITKKKKAYLNRGCGGQDARGPRPR